MTQTTILAIATTDHAWIARMGGTHDGRYAQVPFPSADVESFTFAGQPMRRVTLVTMPSDWKLTRDICSPVVLCAS